ncbi:MAG: hypothetical protein ABIN58_02090, partial [candidate division WOR-3 bacterium]
MIGFVLFLFADDAPAYYFSGTGTGAPADQHLVVMEDCPVEMERESVIIWLDEHGARVRVSYLFMNPTDKAISLLLVLPCDSGDMRRWIDGAEAPVSYSERTVPEGEMWGGGPFGPIEAVSGYEVFPEILAVTPVSFPPGKPVRVAEEYYLFLADWSVFWSRSENRWYIGAVDHERALLYPLQTVKYWGSGKVGDFVCIIHPGDVGLDWFRLQDGFAKKGKDFVFSQKNFSPDKDIWVIYYQPTDGFATASSCLDLERYGPGKATDGDTTTCWAEGVSGNGAGEWLFLSLVDMMLAEGHIVSSAPVMLKGFTIWPGYHKSADLLDKNAAPREIKVIVYYSDKPVDLCYEDHFACYYPCKEGFDESDENLPAQLDTAIDRYF